MKVEFHTFALLTTLPLAITIYASAKTPAMNLKTMKPTLLMEPQLVVKDAVSSQVQPFDLGDVTLLDSPFKAAMERDGKYLLSLSADRLLSGFRTDAGLQPKAPIYGGWEAQGVAGHSMGHYLSALALYYRSTGDQTALERMNYIVDELALCQEKRGSGYLGAYTDGGRIWSEIARGDVHSAGFDLNGGWVPWYTNHKVMAGLRDVYLLTGNERAKTELVKFADWCIDVTKNLDDAKWQLMLQAEHGGMNEVLADVYAITGDRKYLQIAEKFYHRAILDPLSQRRDDLAGKHANTQIPKVIGMARLYELTGQAKDNTIPDYFWHEVTGHHSYVIGGNSDFEHFGEPDKLSQRLSTNTTETCNTYNMLKLTRHLFEWKPSVQLADFYERALYNHILSSQNPDDGMVTYYVPLASGQKRTYGTPEDSFWCCTGTGMENHVKYGDSIYYHDANSLWVNGFIPSVVNWRDKGITLRQETQYPQSETTRLTIQASKATNATLKIRCPQWLARAAKISVNGKVQKIAGNAGSYAEITRTWKSGDTVEVTLPMTLTQEAMPDDATKVAFLYGPIVLAGDLGATALQHTPVLVNDGSDFKKWFAPVAGQPLTFRTNGAARPNDVTLKPFNTLAHDRYVVYWDVFSPTQWKERELQIEADAAAQRALELRRVDEVRFGEQQPETDHKLQSEKSNAGRALDSNYRHAPDGGWFSVEMKVTPDKAMELACKYWGDESGARQFDILVDGRVIATPSLAHQKPGQFYTVTYPIPQALTQGKTSVTVRFQAKPNNIAGGVFGCWMLRAQA